jgi:hypothetical protein
MGDLPRENWKKVFLRWSYCNRWPTQVKNAKIFQRFFFKMVKNAEIFQSGLVVMGDLPRWKVLKVAKIFQSGEKYEDFSKWSYCNGWPAHVKSEKYKDFLKWWKIQRFFKVVLLYWVTCLGEKWKEFSKWWKMWRFFKVVRNAKICQDGFIIMGNQPKWKMKRVFKEVWLWWVTCLGEKMKCRYDYDGWPA